MIINCPACGNPSIDDFTHVKDFPLFIFPVPFSKKDDIKTKDLITFMCNNCFHIFKEPTIEEDIDLIYKEYYQYYPYDSLETMNEPYRIPFERFFDKVYSEYFDRSDGFKKLLEIGCSSGKQLSFFKNYNIEAHGIDPSPLVNKDNNIHNGKFELYSFNEKFDLIISRFNLEHVNYLDMFFSKVSNDLNDNGLFFVQVPNVGSYILNGIASFVAHEHTHYFNAYSLLLCAENNGFQIVDTLYNGSQSIIFAMVKNNKGLNQSIGKISYKIKKDEFNYFNEYKKRILKLKDEILIALGSDDLKYFYGAGLNLSWLLYDIKIPTMSINIIDDNDIIENRYMPNTNLIIKKYENTNFLSNSKICLTLNPVYHNQIISKINNNNRLISKIYTFDKDGLKLIY